MFLMPIIEKRTILKFVVITITIVSMVLYYFNQESSIYKLLMMASIAGSVQLIHIPSKKKNQKIKTSNSWVKISHKWIWPIVGSIAIAVIISVLGIEYSSYQTIFEIILCVVILTPILLKLYLLFAREKH